MSYKSDYTGAQIDAILKESKVTQPVYTEGMVFVINSGWKGDAGYFSPLGKTLTASSAGNEKKLYDRLIDGLPIALQVPIAASANADSHSNLPFVLVEGSNISGILTMGTYRSVTGLYTSGAGYKHEITVTVNHQNKTVTLAGAPYTEKETEVLQNFSTGLFKVNKDGTLNQSTAQTLSASSTGEAKLLYERLQKGFPAMIMVKMTNSEDTDTEVWLSVSQIQSGKTYKYESCELSNGTFSGKKVRLMLSKTKAQCFMDNVVSG